MITNSIFNKILVTVITVSLFFTLSFLVGFNSKTESPSSMTIGEHTIIANGEEDGDEEKGIGKGLNIDALISFVQAMTTKHLAILQEVYENAPDAAKGQILKAIGASTKGSIKAIEALNKVKQADKGNENKGQEVFHVISSCNNGGTITPKGHQRTSGESITFTCAANTGYELVWLRVDNEKKIGITSYTFSNVDRNHTIHAHFKKIKPE